MVPQLNLSWNSYAFPKIMESVPAFFQITLGYYNFKKTLNEAKKKKIYSYKSITNEILKCKAILFVINL